MSEGERAVYRFNLTDVGGLAFHVDSDGNKSAFSRPTVDETSLDLSNYTVDSAQLSFRIGGFDQGAGVPDESIKIRIKGESESGTPLSEVFDVSIGVDTFYLDIAPDWLADGMLKTVAIAVSGVTPGGENDFKIRYAQLSGTAINAIAQPEPGTIILLSSGLIGLAAYGRKKFKKK